MKKLLLSIVVALFTLNVNAQLDKDLLANWSLNGNADDANNVYNGSFVGDVTPTGDRFGNIGCAVKIGQTNSYFQYYKAGSFNNFLFFQSDCTLSFWFMPDNIQRTVGAHLVRHTFHYSNPYYNNYYIDLEKNDTLNMCKKIATHFSLSKIWNHLVISYGFDVSTKTYKANTYLNNQLIEESNQYCFGGESYDAFLRFGENVGTKLDDLRFYNRALSSSEVAILFNLPSSCTITGIENEQQPKSNKTLVRILTPLGQELKQEQAVEGLFIYQYNDGSVKKMLIGSN